MHTGSCWRTACKQHAYWFNIKNNIMLKPNAIKETYLRASDYASPALTYPDNTIIFLEVDY